MSNSKTLNTTKPISHFRGPFLYVEAFYFMLVLLWGIFIYATCESCSMNGLQSDVQYSKCGPLKQNPYTDDNEFSSAAYSFNIVPEETTDRVCQQGNLFCFRSTLPGFSSSSLKSPVLESDVELTRGLKSSVVNGSQMMDSGSYDLYGEGVVSCSVSYQDIFPSLHIQSSIQHDMSSCMEPTHDQKDDYTGTVKSDIIFPQLEINPTVLDFGEQYLYFPKSASLAVKNTHSDVVLNLYAPYSTNPHFYPCNFSEISLAPGEMALVSFIFFPTLLGMSSGQLILQTSVGGFLIHAKGLVVESPYAIRPLIGQSRGKLRENLSLFNPSNEAIFVQELAVWIVISSENSSSSTKLICSVDTSRNFSAFRFNNVNEWLNFSSELDRPIVAVRASQNFEIAPGKAETVIEVDISHSAEGKISGAVCMHLFNSTEKIGKVMVPLDAKWKLSSTLGETVNPVSVSVDVFLPCDTSGTVVASLSVRNDALYMLRIVKVSVVGGGRKHFDIKYIEGLLLFPGTDTKVALATYTMVVQNDDSRDEIGEHDRSCKLLIQTNESSNFESEIHCEKVAEFCLGHRVDSSTGFTQQLEGADIENSRLKLRGRDAGSLPLPKVLDSAEAEELVLMNWKSHSTTSNMSILDDHEIIFATVQVGSHFSEWITVTNPSRQPVVVQLILNSAEIIDECQEPDRLQLHTSFSSLVGEKSSAPTRYGFSIAENAVTEAFVHPFERALLGPIVFQPSRRCGWKSSALLRNNLSGVEWLSLQGFGGLLSLSLLEDYEPVQRLDFKLNLSSRLNFSSRNNYRTVNRTQSCLHPSTKELYAKNTGDLPLEVKKVKVSGTRCGLDGFSVHTCGGFSLEPGESKKFIVSYQTDYSAPIMYRDLELSLTTGILVIPMKASVPIDMFHFCKRSVLLIRAKKYITVFLAVLGPFVVICCILPHLSTFGSHGYMLRNGVSVSNTEKSFQHITKNASNFRISSQINGSIKLTVEEEVLLLKPVSGVSDGQISHNQELPFSHVNLIPGDGKERNSCLDKKETVSPSREAASPIDRSNIQEMPLVGNMTVKIGNEKSRRRRKKKSSAAGAPAVFEVSSSHSGNSTPSSPLSSSSSSTPRPLKLSSDGNKSGQIRNLFAHDEKSVDPNPVPKVRESDNGNWFSSAQEKPTTPKTVLRKPVLLPSATFPRSGRPAPNLMRHPPLVSLSKLAPYDARAPGSKLHGLKSRKGQEKARLEEQFTYDIWGDHILGKPLACNSTVSKKPKYAIEDNFSSFFVWGPQTLMKADACKFPGNVG